MKTLTSSVLSTSGLLFVLLAACTPLGTGCVANVDTGEGDSSDGSALEHNPFAAYDDEEDDATCELGATQECVVHDPGIGDLDGFQTCVEIEGELTWGECQMSGASTPLVLSFEKAPVAYSAAMGGSFDLTGLGVSVATDWPTAATPWLALDRDGNGAIDGGEELFGSATRLDSGLRADNGFSALRELDSDGDGRITPADAAWSRLTLWTDRDGDRASTPVELAPLASRGITSIELRYERDARCDGRGNCEIERAGFTYDDASGLSHEGAVIDVHLRFQ